MSHGLKRTRWYDWVNPKWDYNSAKFESFHCRNSLICVSTVQCHWTTTPIIILGQEIKTHRKAISYTDQPESQRQKQQANLKLSDKSNSPAWIPVTKTRGQPESQQQKQQANLNLSDKSGHQMPKPSRLNHKLNHQHPKTQLQEPSMPIAIPNHKNKPRACHRQSTAIYIPPECHFRHQQLGSAVAKEPNNQPLPYI